MKKGIRSILWGGVLTPRGWVVRAALILLAFAIAHLLGWRADTKIISGTGAPRDFAGELAVVRGVVYGFLYFAVVIVAPILVIGAGIFKMVLRWRGWRGSAT